jgi:hypothetical protein
MELRTEFFQLKNLGIIRKRRLEVEMNNSKETKIINLLKKKIDEATPEELEEAMKIMENHKNKKVMNDVSR